MTYVSALEAQADPGIVSGSTIERKKMSTKTIYKRIALVAVAALGMGVLTSVSPANAGTNTYMWCEVADGLANGTATDDVCTGVAGPANTVTLTFENVPTNARVTITGVGSTFGTPSAATSIVTVPTNALTATFVNATAANNDSTISVLTPTVGTVTVSLFELVATGIYKATATDTVTITVNAAAIAGGINTTTTTSLIKDGTIWSSITKDDTILEPATAAVAPVAAVKVVLGQLAGAITTTTKVTASVSGPGLLYLNDDNDHTTTPVGSGRSLSSTLGSSGINAETFYVLIAPDGNPGVATITITAGTFTTTETVTFYGTVATLTATAVRGSIPDTAAGTANGDTDAYAAVITGKDSAGNTVPVAAGEFTAVTAAALTAADITAAGFATADAGTYSGVKLAGTETVVVIDPTATKTGAKSLTITHTDSKLTVAVPFTVGLVRATAVTLTTDKATYLPGEKMVLTLTATAGGVAIADVSAATDLLAAGGITSNVSLVGDTTTATDPGLVAGKKTWTVYAPLTSGPVVFAGKTGATTTTYAPSAAVVTLAATATVSASADATANAAAVATLTTLVNSLIAKINALNKLVIKIQKKVRA
jgi:trimeric autotransporter adhesin